MRPNAHYGPRLVPQTLPRRSPIHRRQIFAQFAPLIFALGLGLGSGAPLRSENPPPPSAPASVVPGVPAPAGKELRIAIEAKVVEVDPEAFAAAGVSELGQTVFSDSEYQVILRCLNQKKGVELFSTLYATADSKQRAVVGASRKIRCPIDWEQADGKWKAKAFETRDIMALLDVTPEVKADSSIDLELKPRFLELLGYVDPVQGESSPARPEQ